MPSVIFTVTAAEAARISTVAQAGGFPADGKAWVSALVRQAVQQYEQSQNQTTFSAGYVPVNPV